MKINSHVPNKHVSPWLFLAPLDLMANCSCSLSFAIMSSTTQPTQHAARDGTTIPEGFAMGVIPGESEKYLMPQYMVPAFEHSLLVDGVCHPTARPAGSAEHQSPYDGSAMTPSVVMPDDRVSFLHFIIALWLITQAVVTPRRIAHYSPMD